MLETLHVELGERAYPILIGDGLLGDETLIAPAIGGRQVMIVTNETVAPLYLERVQKALRDFAVDVCIVPDGEAYKTLATYETVLDALMAHRHNRTTTLVALGGGVIGDLTGFAAATYQRGVGFVQLPTTLLAQVDSSVGGKTAVNHPRGKNMIGAFHQPKRVVADTSVLGTLPQREYFAGVAEVIKYGVVRDGTFFDWLDQHQERIRDRDPAALMEAVKRSCVIKAAVVAADERESGERAILNYGHTFGHAIEVLTDYAVLHGESVAIGMVMAADVAWRIGWIGRREAERVRSLVEAFGLPSVPPAHLDPSDMLAVMGHDKKVLDGRLRLVLPRRLGRVEVTEDVDSSRLAETLRAGEALCRA